MDEPGSESTEPNHSLNLAIHQTKTTKPTILVAGCLFQPGKELEDLKPAINSESLGRQQGAPDPIFPTCQDDVQNGDHQRCEWIKWELLKT